MIRERERAAYALSQVNGVKEHDKKDKYKTWLVKLPAQLHVNGLGQTVAFYLSAGSDKPEARIVAMLEGWLTREGGVYERRGRLIDAITGGSDLEYRRASVEARALSLWLKRFAEAFIQKPEKKQEPPAEGVA